MQYWTDKLAGKAFEYRNIVPATSPGINAAVAKLPGWVDPFFKDEYVRAISGSGLHAEERIIKIINDAKQVGPDGKLLTPKQITELFTERSPCEDICAPLLRTELSPEAKIFYSIVYDGESKLERQLMAKLLEIKAKGGL